MVKFVRRDKLVDMQVYDKKGRLVGTVRDIGFIPGENAVGLVVTTKDRSEIEIHWSEVSSIEDVILLSTDYHPATSSSSSPSTVKEEKEGSSPLKQAEAEVRVVTAQKQGQAQKGRFRRCPKCGAENDQRYKYCHKCGAKLQPPI